MGLPFRGVKLRELPPISRPGEGPPRALRVVGFVSLAVIFVSICTVDPKPGLSGDGPLVALGLVLLAVGIAGSLGRRPMPPGRRLAALVLAAVATCLLTAIQPDSAAYAGIYYVVVIAGMRFERTAGVLIGGAALGALVAVVALTNDHADGQIPGLLFSVVPWFLVMRLVRRPRYRCPAGHALVEARRQ